MKKMKRILCMVLAFLMVFTGIPFTETEVQAAETNYSLKNYGSGFLMDCTASTSTGLARTFAEDWFQDKSQDVFYRVTTGNCTASEANNNSKKILVRQADYKPTVSMGTLKNGVFTPYKQYWNPTESGTYKVWKMEKQSNGVYGATDENCISFNVTAFHKSTITIEGVASGEGRVIINGKEYADGETITLENGKYYEVSEKNIAGYKLKSLSSTKVTGMPNQTIKAVYEPATACTYKVVNEGDHGTLTVDGKTGTFNGAVGVAATIKASAHYKVSGASIYRNQVKAIYVNGKELDLKFGYIGKLTAEATFTPETNGEYVITVEYDVNELIGDTSKVFTFTDSRDNNTSVELFEHIFGESLKQVSEADRPQVNGISVTYLAGQRYSCGVGGMNWYNYDCWLKFSEDLPEDVKGMFGNADRFHDTSNPPKHLFGGLGKSDTDITTEKIIMKIPAGNGVFSGTTLTLNIKVSRSGMTIENDSVLIGKTDDAFETMQKEIGAKFRGEKSDLFTYTDKSGVTVDQEYLDQVENGKTFEIVVGYPGDDTFGPASRTVSVSIAPSFSIERKTATFEKTYDENQVAVSASNGDVFSWKTRGYNEQAEILYYDSEGELLESAPKDPGNYTAKIAVTDKYGTEISEEAVAVKIHKVNSNLKLSAVPTKTYGQEQEFELSIYEIMESADKSKLTFTSDNENVVTVDENGKVTIVGAGTAVITAVLPEAGTYTGAEDSVVVIIDKAQPTLTFEKVEDKTYGDEAFALKLLSNTSEREDGEIRYYTRDGSIANVDPVTGVVTVSGSGEAVIIARLEETANYYGADVEISFSVARADTGIVIQDADKVYDGSAVKIQYTTNHNGRVVLEYKQADEADTAYTAESPKNAGSYVVRATVQESKQYNECSATKEFTISQAEVGLSDLTLENGGYVMSKVYDGTNEVTVSGAEVAGLCSYYGYDSEKRMYTWIADDVTVDLSNAKATVSGSDVGTYTEVAVTGLALSGEAAANYTIKENVNFTYGGSRDFYISERYVEYIIEDQTIAVDGVYTDEYGYVQQGVYIVGGEKKEIDDLIDPNKYAFDEEGLLEGHSIESANLSVGSGVITMNNATVVDEQGNDVTDNYAFIGQPGMVDIAINCDDHSFDDNGFCPNCENYQPAQGVADEYGVVTYDIYNAGQLFWFAKQVNDGINPSAKVRLMADIDLNPGYTFNEDGTVSYEGETVDGGWRAWTPIGLGYTNGYGVYSGSFDGQGHLISGVYINMPDKDAIGLFGWIDYNPTVQDLHLTNSYIKGRKHVGAIGGYFFATMKNCTVDTTVTVEGENWVGGFAGYAGTAEIINCASAAKVSSTADNTNFAGLVAYNCSAISNSYCTTDKLVALNNEDYGGSLTNCFYLDESGDAKRYEGTTAVTAEQLASGEIAYLLQQGQVGEMTWDDELQADVETGVPAQIWGQNIDLEGFEKYDPLPVLHGPKVYYGYKNCESEEAVYSNSELNAEKGEHKYGEWVSDAEKHWKACSCGSKAEEGEHQYGEWVFNEENHWKACSCGLKAEEGNHDYENGYCTCGKSTSEETSGSIKLTSASLTLEDEVYYNIYFETTGLDDVSPENMGLMVWDASDENLSIEDPDVTYEGVRALDGEYKVCTDSVPAKEMGDTKIFVAYAKLSDETYVYSDPVEYSGKIYAMNRLENSSDPAIKRLCVALLNYGADAQKYFDYHTDALMNADLTEKHQALVESYSSNMVAALGEVSDEKTKNFTGNAEAFSDKQASLTLGGAFAINYYFTPSEDTDSMTLYYWSSAAYDAAEKLTVDNASGSVNMSKLQNSNEFKGTIENIVAKKFDETIYACGVYVKDGVTYSTGVIPYHVGRYCVNRATNGSTEDMKSLAKSTAVYGYYAKEYFTNND